MSDEFLSSDSVRSSNTLRHVKKVRLDKPLSLELGGRLPGVTIAYETYGKLNSAKDNAVMICHALSGDSHVARHNEEDDPGWWDVAVGPGKAIDTRKYFVICSNTLGGCRGTTGPNSINPATGKPYGADFPTITTGDMIDVQRRLIEHLGIRALRAVVGGSVGGHQVLTWATKHPNQIRGAIALATSPRMSMQALAFDVVGRNAIQSDPNYRGGNYYENGPGPSVGLALARMLGHITYLSAEAMQDKFEADRLKPRDVPTEFEKKFSVGSYLAYQGDKFVERFDANSYVTISMAMDLFNLGKTSKQLSTALAQTKCRWLVVSFTSDWLFPPEQSREIVDALIGLDKPVNYCNVTSRCGHDAFLLPDDLDRYGAMMGAFLENLGEKKGKQRKAPASYHDDPTSIFSAERLDYDGIMDLIPQEASVLDLGCGQGGLLARLKARGNKRLMGVELDEKEVTACVQLGLSVVQADLNQGLPAFPDRQFDYVVLSQTLQAVRDVERVVEDMLRVGRRCILTFPNFGYHKLRKMLSEQGRAPESDGILRHKWYNSPNIRFFTISDFEELCHERKITIHRRVALDTEEGIEVTGKVNLLADMAIFVISR